MDKAFIKGLRLIEALSLSETPRGVTDLAGELRLTKSNVHRLLVTLQQQGYVRQLPQQSDYELTTKIWELGSRVIGRMDLPKIARPAMVRLAQQTRETIHLSVLDNTDVVYVDKIESEHHIRTHTSVGWRAPAWTVATGKAMLARMPDEYLLRFNDHFRQYTPTSKASLKALRQDIKTIRAQGFAAVYHGEWREGIAAVACAIVDRSGQLVGGIGISGPDTRIKKTQIKEYSVYVMAAAAEVSRLFGYARPESTK